MENDNGSNGESVTVSMEIAGKYEDVMDRLDTDGARRTELATVTDDLAAIVETIEQTGGATRSNVADELSGRTAVEYGPEDVVPALQVLERYDVVALDGNTWKPTGNRES